MASSLPNFKKFVSEDEIEEAKRKRQEEWEKVRKPDEPKEAPEEEYDPRSLFERLEANRIKKQEEYDESHRLKNMVRGLENDEIEFLEFVSRQRELDEQQKDVEEKLLLAEYKSSLVYDRTKDEESSSPGEKVRPAPSKPIGLSQKALLAGVIKKKRPASESEPAAIHEKAARTNPAQTEVNAPHDSGTNKKTEAVERVEPAPSKSLLPGLCDYSDSESGSD